MLKWNDNKKYAVKTPIITANGPSFEIKIHFDPPVYIKVNNLPVIPMKALMVPLKKSESGNYHYLLGLDFISQLKMIISTINGHTILRFEEND